MSSMKKDVEAVIAAAAAQGWRCSRTASNHHQLYSPDKHTIVVVSDKTTDSHAFNNFLSEMRKGGYVECDARPATHSLGEALLEARTQPPAARAAHEPASPRKLTIPQIVIPFLERDGKHSTTEDLVMLVKHHRPIAERTSIVSQLSQLCAQGRIRHVARGLYAAAAPPAIGLPPEAPVPEAATPNLNGAAPVERGTMTDREVIAELLGMQSAFIAALARVEAIVQALRHRGE